MFFKTSIKEKGGVEYTHYRLCESYREGRLIRNRTLLSIGDIEAELPVDKINLLTKRINQVYFENKTFVITAFRDDRVESICTKIVAELHAIAKKEKEAKKAKGIEEVYVDRTTTSHVRETGAEWLCLQACEQLELKKYFEKHNWNKASINLALTQIVSRAIFPFSELKTSKWLKENSALCELLGYESESVSKDKLYQMASELYKHKAGLERHLSNRTNELFNFTDQIILYDLTNTYFEGSMRKSKLAQFGRSKEKRSDAKLVVLAAVVNPEGFLKESQLFEGNMSDPVSLKTIVEKLKANPIEGSPRQVVVLDAGIATKENLQMLRDENFDYVCVSRSKIKNYKILHTEPVRISDNRNNPIEIHKIEQEGETDTLFEVRSFLKAVKEQGMHNRFTEAFETGINQISNALSLKGGTKKIEKVWERIGRLRQKYSSVSKIYTIDVKANEEGIAVAVQWSKQDKEIKENQGIYFLRTSLESTDENTIWKIYNTITEIESTFRCLKTDLNLRPVFHKTDVATMSHLHLGLLAYQVVSTVRYQLKQKGINSQWMELVRVMNSQKMVTTTFVNTDLEHIVVRKCSEPEDKLKEIYSSLNYHQRPFIKTKRKKSVVPQSDPWKNQLTEHQCFIKKGLQCGLTIISSCHNSFKR